MYCFKCEKEITDGTVCDRCGYDNKSDGSFLFPVGEIVFQQKFIIEDGVLVGYKGRLSTVVIPEGVKEIGRGVFKGRKSIKEVVIPEGVKVVGEQAFRLCPNLVKVNIPDGVTGIGALAFAYCTSLESVAIPDSVTSVGECAFLGCIELKKVSYPETAQLGADVFEYCSKLKLANIEIRKAEKATQAPQNAVEPSANAVEKTSTSTAANTSTNNTTSNTSINRGKQRGKSANKGRFSWLPGLLYILFMCVCLFAVVGCVVLFVGASGLFCAYDGTQEYFEDDNCVIENGVLTEYKWNTLFVIIPDGVTEIDAYTFQGCDNMKYVKIPDGLTNIGYEAFSECDNLKKIKIPDSVSSVDNYAFLGCDNLEKVSYSETTDISVRAFDNCLNLTEENIEIREVSK